MARPPKLRKKNGYWMTKAGGTETYFGKVAKTPHADARRLFLDHLQSLSDGKPKRRAAITAEILCDRHLDWLGKNRSEDLYKQRRYLLSMWCDFEVAAVSACMALRLPVSCRWWAPAVGHELTFAGATPTTV